MSVPVKSFISQFSQWVNHSYLPKSSAQKLPGILRQVIYEELPKRDSSFLVHVRELTNSANLPCSIVKDDVWCYPKKGQGLVTGVVFPHWRRGWRDICGDESICDLISDFFHFASQYVSRSRVVDITGSIALTYHQACDFRGDWSREVELTMDDSSSCRLSELRKDATRHQKKICRGKERELTTWCKILNSLDPFMNRILFNYIRAVDLFENNFCEEAIVALDNAVCVASQFAQERLTCLGKNPRSAMSLSIGMSKSDTQRLDRLYKLRCSFGAHPGLSKWWDFFEVYEDSFEEMFEVVKKVILKIAHKEQATRVVDKHPESWALWFNVNAMMIWNSVWFHRLPP